MENGHVVNLVRWFILLKHREFSILAIFFYAEEKGSPQCDTPAQGSPHCEGPALGNTLNPPEVMYWLVVTGTWMELFFSIIYIYIYILGMSSSQVTFIFFRGVGLNHQPVPLISQISSSSAPPKDPPYRRAAHLRISREFNERCGLCQLRKEYLIIFS